MRTLDDLASHKLVLYALAYTFLQLLSRDTFPDYDVYYFMTTNYCCPFPNQALAWVVLMLGQYT